MRTHKILVWLLIAIFASVVGLLTSPIGQGHNSMQRQPTRFKVLRRKDQLAFKPTAKEIQDQEPPQLERILENQIPKHVPLKIRIKKEKEEAFKNLNNVNWARDFQLEVTNTGDKPIYEFYLLLVTDVKAAAGYKIVAPLTYGRPELANLKARPTRDDVPINAGETYVLTIHTSQLQAWEQMQKKEHRALPKKVQIKLQGISFGDGTGYIGNEGVLLPRSTSQQNNSEGCIEARNRSDPIRYVWDAITWLNDPERTPSRTKPALRPVNFLSGKFSIGESASIQGCCAGTNCTSLTRWSGIVCLNCPPQNRPGTTFCSDPLGACLNAQEGSIECVIKPDIEPLICQTFDLIPCSSSPTPSPTPTPSPSPSSTPLPTPEGCDPNTRPNSTNCSCINLPLVGPVWTCFCPGGKAFADYTVFPQSGGCDPSKSVNDGSNCCACINQSPCGPGFYRNSYSCECEPTTTPTPTPTPPSNYQYQAMCTDYWWVLYECIPVGEDDWDCHEVDRWYAGCLQV